MPRKYVVLLLMSFWVFAAPPAVAADVSLGARKFEHLSLAVGETPADCRNFVDQGAALSYVRDYLTAGMGPFVTFVNTDNAAVLLVTFDCLRLVDTSDRGDGRTIGYAVNLDFHFFRPFYEDITYIYAAPWNTSTLLFIPATTFSQDYFNELLDESLDTFITLWLADHPKAVKSEQK